MSKKGWENVSKSEENDKICFKFFRFSHLNDQMQSDEKSFGIHSMLFRTGVGTSEIFFGSDRSAQIFFGLDLDPISWLKIFLDRIGRLKITFDRIWIGSIGS